jgi:uncharacterized BrkB/YihY/UPF0761 family membrane protein
MLESFDRPTYAGEHGVLAWALGTAFVLLNTLRILVYFPQLVTCLKDRTGCAAVNLWTWGMWILANAVTGLYMWVFFDDLRGFVLQIGNAGMCAAIFGVAVAKRLTIRLDQGTNQEPIRS